MLRKGYTDTDITAVESMVAVHNFLNEGAWSEILEWESLFSSGLSHGWNICRRGEGGIAQERARREFAKQRRELLGLDKPKAQDGKKDDENTEPKLIRFQGFPQQPTPKARILSLLGNAFPSHFSSEPPFDRHDWHVERRLPDGTKKEVRYVIDYYSGGEEGNGQQVFYLDIRPALDTPTAVAERAMRWGGDVWWGERLAAQCGRGSSDPSKRRRLYSQHLRLQHVHINELRQSKGIRFRSRGFWDIACKSRFKDDEGCYCT